MSEVPVDDAVEMLVERPIVMVVDDEPLVADTLAMILTHAGYRAVRAYDAKTALEMASVRAPDLLISDVAMPEMNGVELALGMVAMAPGCKVVLFSGHARSVDLIRAYDAGHDFPLMAKPMHPTEMLGQVAKSLAQVSVRSSVNGEGLFAVSA
ncbi:response regulator [Granulicella sp. L46]|uniref:response regulator n=1 Tax=Granulicella sp. L46 TaxID=1641865 RepID=UPI0020B1301C|nr:response regulator [Granulicella sp. L46]